MLVTSAATAAAAANDQNRFLMPSSTLSGPMRDGVPRRDPAHGRE
jgi:hypothetical protein